MNEKKSKKYEFIKNGMDDWTLKYKDKEINFNSKVEYIYDLQEIIKNARVNLVMDLAKQGKTIDDLIVKRVEGGITTEDHSSKDYLEQQYIQDEQEKVFNDVLKKMLGMGFYELLGELELTTSEESKELGKRIGEIIRNETPR